MPKLFYLFPLFLFACQSNEGHDSIENSEENTTQIDVTAVPEKENVPMHLDLTAVEANEIPNLDYKGNVHNCLTWDDNNGQNYLIQTIEDPILHEMNEEGWETQDQSLHVYHYAVSDGENTLLRDLNDFVKGCEFDLILNFIETVELSDIDGDNYGEIVFGYRVHCTSDVSSSDQKVLIFENGDKYILRGQTLVLGYGGDYKVGDEFDTAPEGFLEKAETYWENNKVEYDFEADEY